jgi:hypothetical protein
MERWDEGLGWPPVAARDFWVVAMARFATIAFSLFLLVALRVDAAERKRPVWLQRAPLNTDTSLVGFKSSIGLARAYRYLTYLLNLAVLAGLLYALAKNEADFSYFVYVYLGILVGGILLSLALSPFLHAFALLPVVAVTTFLLARFCNLSLKRAALVATVFHAYQVGYILVYTAIAGG